MRGMWLSIHGCCTELRHSAAGGWQRWRLGCWCIAGQLSVQMVARQPGERSTALLPKRLSQLKSCAPALFASAAAPTM